MNTVIDIRAACSELTLCVAYGANRHSNVPTQHSHPFPTSSAVILKTVNRGISFDKISGKLVG